MSDVQPLTPITPVPMPTDLSLVPAASSPIAFPDPANAGDFNAETDVTETATATANADDTVDIALTDVVGIIGVPSTVTGPGVPANTTLSAQVSGTPGGDGVYTASVALTLVDAGLTFTYRTPVQIPIDPGGNTPGIVVDPATVIPGEPREKTAGTFPYTLVLPTFAFMPLVQGVRFNLSAVPPWQTEDVAPGPTPPPILTMTRTPPFPAYPS